MYQDNEKYRFWLNLAQGTAIFEIVFAVLRWTRNSPATVIPQVLSRLFVLWLVFPQMLSAKSEQNWWVAKEWPILPACVLAWAITEVFRFSYYTFTGLQSGFLGHARYNLFIVLYPLGVTAELLCMWSGRHAVLGMAQSDRPFSLIMPNSLNFEWKYEWMAPLMYLIYVFGFPQLYFYMLAQRKKFYAPQPKNEKKTK